MILSRLACDKGRSFMFIWKVSLWIIYLAVRQQLAEKSLWALR